MSSRGGFLPIKQLYLGFEILGKIAEGVGIDGFHTFAREKCYEGTRLGVLATITSWGYGSQDRKNGVLWLHGFAGTGKSTIIQTITERFRDRRKLAASYFFSRSNHRDSAQADYFLATIVYQLGLSIPAIRGSIAKAVERNPMVFSSSLKTQMKTLIVDPLLTLGKDIQLEANIITIDGLDECRHEKFQREILQVIWNTLIHYNLPLYFVIASRPEPHLEEMFQMTIISEIYTPLCLSDEEEERYIGRGHSNFRTLVGQDEAKASKDFVKRYVQRWSCRNTGMWIELVTH